MTITELHWHSGSGLFSGIARSVRGRRYRFGVRRSGVLIWVDRELREATGVYWLHLRKGPPAVTRAVRSALRKRAA